MRPHGPRTRRLLLGGVAIAAMHAAATPLAIPAAAGAQSRPAKHDFSLDPAPSTYQPLPRKDTLITHATILDGMGRRLENAGVLMRDGKIVAVGDLPSPPSDVTVIDASGRWVTPGLIDVHTHYGTSALPGTIVDHSASDTSELSSPNVADTWIEHAINVQSPSFDRALRGGVTTLMVLPGSVPVFGGRTVVLKPIIAATVQQMKFPGAAHGLKMACGEYPKLQGVKTGRSPNTRQGIAALIRTEFNAAKKYREDWRRFDAGRQDSPPDMDLKLETLAAALGGDINLHIHCYRSDDMATLANIAQEFGLKIAAFHHAVESYKISTLLQRTDICSAVWSDWWGWTQEVMDGIRENAAYLDAAGACAVIHSDSSQKGQRLNLEVAKAAAAGRRAGLAIPPEQAIRWITSNAAKVLSLGDRIGRIAPAYNADVVIWSANPLSVYSHPDLVFIDGAVAYDRTDRRYQQRSDIEIGLKTGLRP